MGTSMVASSIVIIGDGLFSLARCMVLQTNGPISIGNLSAEFGATTADGVQLSEFYTKAGAPGIGNPINISYFWGKANSPTYTYDATIFPFTFEAGTTGRFAPNVQQCLDQYLPVVPVWIQDPVNFSVTNGVQKFKVPVTGWYKIRLNAATCGKPNVWNGAATTAYREGTYWFIAGDFLHMVIGHKGSPGYNATGGGGGTFVFYNDVSISKIVCAIGGCGGSTGTNNGLPNSGTGSGIAGTGGTNPVSRFGVSGTTYGVGGSGNDAIQTSGAWTTNNGAGGGGGGILNVTGAPGDFIGGQGGQEGANGRKPGGDGGFGGGGGGGCGTSASYIGYAGGGGGVDGGNGGGLSTAGGGASRFIPTASILYKGVTTQSTVNITTATENLLRSGNVVLTFITDVP
jgi:hypothetical protein